MPEVPSMRELLGDDAPTNWGKWGPDDEVGCLNYLANGEVLRGVQHIRTGDVFTLQGSTQYDALGHVWYDGKLWNGYDVG
jgi:hypothetical protein